MRIHDTEERTRRIENLQEATGESTKSGAIDVAADYYLKMSGDTVAVPNGAVEQMMERAVEQGSVTPEEIAEILHTNELPVRAETSWSVGSTD